MRRALILFLFILPAAWTSAESPLYWAIANNDALEVWKLTDQGSVPGTLTETGREPPSWAVERGAGEALEVLIWRGSPLDGVDEEGRNLLFPAAAQGRIDLFLKVRAGGARIEQTDIRGNTLVHVAAVSPHPSMLSLLLGSGLGSQVRTVIGVTPLMEACLAGRAAEADLLLRWGAVPEDEDYLGRSVRDYAVRGGDGSTLARIDAALSPWTIGPDGGAPLP